MTAVLDGLDERVYESEERVRAKLAEIAADLTQIAKSRPTCAVNSDIIQSVIDSKQLPYTVIWDVLD